MTSYATANPSHPRFSANPAHREFLAEAIRGARDRRIALFQHKPITEEALADNAVNYWPLLPNSRAELLAMFDGRRPALVASGHVHQQRDRVADGIRQIWAPAIGFTSNPRSSRCRVGHNPQTIAAIAQKTISEHSSAVDM